MCDQPYRLPPPSMQEPADYEAPIIPLSDRMALIDAYLPEMDVLDYIAELRVEGESWATIADLLREDTGITVHASTVQRYFEAHTPAGDGWTEEWCLERQHEMRAQAAADAAAFAAVRAYATADTISTRRESR